MATRRDWLHAIPPWRIPLPRVRRRYGRRVGFGDTTVAFLLLLGWLLIVEIGAAIWLAEVTAWGITWFYWGLFLGARALYRANPLGRGAAAVAEIRSPAPPVDPYARPVDLAQAAARRHGRT